MNALMSPKPSVLRLPLGALRTLITAGAAGLALVAAAPGAALAQATSAQVGVSARFVDAIGVGHASLLAVPPARVTGAAVRIPASPAEFVTTGASHQTLSIETESSLDAASAIAGFGRLDAAPAVERAGPGDAGRILVSGAAALPPGAPAGNYQGSFSLIVNLN